MVARALQAPIEDTLPAAWLSKLALPGLEASIRLLHQPPHDTALPELENTKPSRLAAAGFRRVAGAAVSWRLHASSDASSSPSRCPSNTLTAAYSRSLPFALTDAQQRAWAEISGDLAAAAPHAAPAARRRRQRQDRGRRAGGLQAIENGFQAAFMAPTEILAEQHTKKLTPLVRIARYCVAPGSPAASAKSQRTASWRQWRQAKPSSLFGTHALFQEAGSFRKLGLVVVDEQHRFGVGQRLALHAKRHANRTS